MKKELMILVAGGFLVGCEPPPVPQWPHPTYSPPPVSVLFRDLQTGRPLVGVALLGNGSIDTPLCIRPCAPEPGRTGRVLCDWPGCNGDSSPTAHLHFMGGPALLLGAFQDVEAKDVKPGQEIVAWVNCDPIWTDVAKGRKR